MKTKLLGLMGVSALLLTACEPGLFAVTIDAVTTPPTTHTIDSERVELAEGEGIALKIFAFTEDPESRDSKGNHPKPLESGGVSVFIDDESIATAQHVDEATWIVIGLKPGHTKLVVNSVSADGFIEVPVLIEPQ